MRDRNQHGATGGRRVFWLGTTLVVLLAITGLLACGGGGGGVKGASEITAEPVSTAHNAFTPSIGTDVSRIQPPSTTTSSNGPSTYTASEPGLYGGTRDHSKCDATKLINYLEQHQDKAQAWSSALQIQPSQIRQYVSGLTDVILRTDTRVTNHGYVNGAADPIQSLLQAGTAVFIDKYGQPVVKCYCGNPLSPPVLYHQPTYTGSLWSDFNTSRVTIINNSTTIINKWTLYDPDNGKTFTRTPGINGHDGPYLNQPANSNPQPSAGTASITLSPNPVMQGGAVSLSASGFAPNSTLSITVNRPDGGTDHFQTTTGADGSGSFTFPATGGATPLGTYNVTATDAAGGSASSSIVVQAPSSSSSSTPASSTSTPASSSSSSSSAPSTGGP